MDKNTFEILVYLLEKPEQLSYKEMADVLGISCDSIILAMDRLAHDGLILKGRVTEKGLRALEPYRVKRAIFLAAGFGSRMVPLTLNTPKPLVRVHGTRMIDTSLDAVVAAGIEEIYIVRGYLGEQFDQLLYKYPGIRFVENPLYDQANNIASALFARSLMSNAYVLEADLVLRNPALIQKYQYCSNFLGIPVESSEDWCFVVKEGVITKQVSNGNAYQHALRPGEQLYQEIGISYWSAEDGEKLSRHIKAVFDTPEGKNRYWDQVQFLDYADQYQVCVRPCKATDIVEIDSYQELTAIDGRYKIG